MLVSIGFVLILNRRFLLSSSFPCSLVDFLCEQRASAFQSYLHVCIYLRLVFSSLHFLANVVK